MRSTFRYELSGFQRVQDYRIDRLAASLAELKEKIRQEQDVLRDFDHEIQSHQDRLIQLIHEQPLFWIESRELSKSYLAELAVKRVAQAETVTQLTAAAEKLMAEIVEARKARMLIEKHRGRRLEAHLRNEDQRQSKWVDEMVLRKYLKGRAEVL